MPAFFDALLACHMPDAGALVRAIDIHVTAWIAPAPKDPAVSPD
jgi:hypothetical protein